MIHSSRQVRASATAIRLSLRLSLCSAFIAAATGTVRGEGSLPAELQPYRVALGIGFDDSAMFPTAYRAMAREQISRIIVRTLGERWSVSALPAADVPTDADAIDRLVPGDLAIKRRASADDATLGLPTDEAPDKLILATIATAGAGYRIVTREWDRLSDSLGSSYEATVLMREDVPRAVVAALVANFRPVAVVSTADGGDQGESRIALTFKASAIPTPDPSILAAKPGTLLLPQLRRFDRDGQLDVVRDVPYTILRIPADSEDVASAAEPGDLPSTSVPVEVHTALRSAFGSRRGRIEAWAIAAPQSFVSTKLILLRREDGIPLAGRTVEVRSQAFSPADKPSPAEMTLLTDRSGAVDVPVDAERPIAWLTIRSGTAVLMRIPLAPGMERTVTLELGDDVRRLDAEGRLAILTGELVEVVAKRATLLATARAGARAGKYQEAETALAEIGKLPDIAAFSRRIAAITTPASKSARDAGDRMTAARIDALGRQAVALVERYLATDPLNATREEVAELKRSDPDTNKSPMPK